MCSASAVCARDAVMGLPAPPLEAHTLTGQSFSLAAQRGKVVVINFWATWCAPCRAEMPALEAFYRNHRDHGLVMLAISADAGTELAAVRLAMAEFSFQAAMMSDAKLPGYGRIRSIPQTYVIDANGILQRDGMTDKGVIDTATLERVILPLLPPRAMTATAQ